LIAGYVLGLSLPAGHYTTNVAWPTIKVDEKTGHRIVDAEWAVIQCETTKDYAINSLLFNNCFGALNNHSCHHLFPAIHHTYYEVIYPVVKQTCKDFNVRIPDVETYSEFMRDYVYNLWDMGFDPKKLM
jgi:fatty acid desaturase